MTASLADISGALQSKLRNETLAHAAKMQSSLDAGGHVTAEDLKRTVALIDRWTRQRRRDLDPAGE